MADTAPGLKLHPFGTVLAYSTDGGSTYIDVSDVLLATPPDLEAEEATVTHIASPGFAEETIGSWLKLGEIPFEFFYVTTGAQLNTMLGFLADRTIRYWRFTLPMASGGTTKGKFVFQAFVKKLKLSEAKAGENNVYSCPAALRIATYTGFAFTPGT